MAVNDIEEGKSYCHVASSTVVTVLSIYRKYWLFGPRIVIYENEGMSRIFHMTLRNFTTCVDYVVDSQTDDR